MMADRKKGAEREEQGRKEDGWFVGRWLCVVQQATVTGMSQCHPIVVEVRDAAAQRNNTEAFCSKFSQNFLVSQFTRTPLC